MHSTALLGGAFMNMNTLILSAKFTESCVIFRVFSLFVFVESAKVDKGPYQQICHQIVMMTSSNFPECDEFIPHMVE